MDNVECPFCGVRIEVNELSYPKHPECAKCPLTRLSISVEQWNMRPPKKEVGHTPQEPFLCHLSGEVGWLRSMVERLTEK